jgi:uncharacterized protein YggU (UPF0235/DUF167 family)
MLISACSIVHANFDVMQTLGVRKRDVTMSTGAKSREKVVIVKGLSAELIYSALKARVVQ